MYRRVSVAIAVVAGVFLVAGAVALIRLGSDAGLFVVFWYATGVVLSLPSLALGQVIARHRPQNPVGMLLTLVGLAIAVIPSVETYGSAAVTGLPLPGVVGTLDQGSWMLMYVPVALLVLYFPEGRLPGPGWRWVAGGLIALLVAFDILAGMTPEAYPPPFENSPHAFGVLPDGAIPFVMALPVTLLVLLIASAASMVGRFRRAVRPSERAQLKWFALAGLWLPVSLLLCWTSYLLLGMPDLALIGLFGLFITIPVGTTIAMLRHDLYDVDKAIAATVTYGTVTTVLLGVYTVVSFTGGLVAGGGSAVVAAGATAVCAAALTPVRSRTQRVVDRRLYPRRRAALDAIAALRQRIDTGDSQPEELQRVLRTALQDRALLLAYKLPGEQQLVDAAGGPIADPEDAVPIVLHGQEIGAVIRSGDATSRELTREVAAASALLVEVTRLRIGLSAALRDVASSRARLLAAGYSERRKLERDLHDGAQQRLVSLGLALRLAQRHLGDGTVDVDGLLDESVAELGTAVAELRAIAHGLRPSSLDDGLDVAVRTLAGSLRLPVTVEVETGPIADDVATTAYYVVSEAVTNAMKHADAGWIGLRLIREDAALSVQVRDDGRGGAQLRPGSGLAGLADRVAAAGGALQVHSPSGRGTTIEAVLPCAS
ncbi:histidine kinase [Hamadaea sp.]|uniref:sensor histidine kinase n=1 Tax=Hamadaea sp. TaxID=2024425 RepID=UPI0025C146FC|nr:histidine kinase [Hamadaea sp.]